MPSSREGLESQNWRDRLDVSRDLGTGFAAPGGEFTRALFEWSLLPEGSFLHEILQNRRVVELGAGIMPYGYAFAAHAGAKNFVAVEPFYADKQELSQTSYIEETLDPSLRIPRKVVSEDMLSYLEGEPDDLLTIVACGIEDCIMPGFEYKKRWKEKLSVPWQRILFFLAHTVI